MNLISSQSPRVGIVLLNFNGWGDTLLCLESLFKLDYPNFFILLCDNHSEDGSLEHFENWAEGRLSPWSPLKIAQKYCFPFSNKPIPFHKISGDRIESIESVPQDKILYFISSNSNLGFSGGNNLGIRFAERHLNYDFLWILNNDTVVDPQALTALVDKAQQSQRPGIVGSKLIFLYSPEYVQSLGGCQFNKWLGTTSFIGFKSSPEAPQEESAIEKQMTYIVGASMLVSKDFLKEVGPLSEDYFLYYEELDWSLRNKKKFEQLFASKSRVYHKEGGSIGANSLEKKYKSFIGDYFSLKNRVLIAQNFFPYTLPLVKLFLLATLLKRLLRQQGERIPWVLKFIFKKAKIAKLRSKEKPKVLLLSVRADFGGGPEHMLLLAGNLLENYEVFIACPEEEPYFSRFETLIGRDHLIPISHRKIRLREIFLLRKLVLEKNIEVIHSHGKGAGILGRILAFFSARSSVHTFHGLHIADYGSIGRFLYLSLEKFLSLFTSKIIAVSRQEQKLLIDHKVVPAFKLAQIDNGVAVSKIPPSPRQTQKKFRVLLSSRFNYQKNTELLLPLLKILKAQDRLDNFSFTLLGDGEGALPLRTQLKEAGLDNHVQFKGVVSNSREFLRESDCFLSTSRWEGMPLAVLEALAEGCPVIASRVVGNSDIIIPGYNGYLYELSEVQSAAEQLWFLSQNSETLEKISKNAYESALLRYSDKSMTQKTQAVYREFLLPAQ